MNRFELVFLEWKRAFGKTSKAFELLNEPNTFSRSGMICFLRLMMPRLMIYPDLPLLSKSYQNPLFTQGKPEKIYYIRYRKDGKMVEEKAGRQYQDDMTQARAYGLRAQKIDGEKETNQDRIKSIDDNQIFFKYRDITDNNATKEMIVSARSYINYLVKIGKDGHTAVRSAIRELEAA